MIASAISKPGLALLLAVSTVSCTRDEQRTLSVEINDRRPTDELRECLIRIPIDLSGDQPVVQVKVDPVTGSVWALRGEADSYRLDFYPADALDQEPRHHRFEAVGGNQPPSLSLAPGTDVAYLESSLPFSIRLGRVEYVEGELVAVTELLDFPDPNVRPDVGEWTHRVLHVAKQSYVVTAPASSPDAEAHFELARIVLEQDDENDPTPVGLRLSDPWSFPEPGRCTSEPLCEGQGVSELVHLAFGYASDLPEQEVLTFPLTETVMYEGEQEDALEHNPEVLLGTKSLSFGLDGEPQLSRTSSLRPFAAPEDAQLSPPTTARGHGGSLGEVRDLQRPERVMFQHDARIYPSTTSSEDQVPGGPDARLMQLWHGPAVAWIEFGEYLYLASVSVSEYEDFAWYGLGLYANEVLHRRGLESVEPAGVAAMLLDIDGAPPELYRFDCSDVDLW